MLAALYRTAGDSSVLSVEEIPTPDPGPGEVRVRLRVSGVNPTDHKMRTTTAPAADFHIPGQDGAGEVDAVGAGVPAARIGERVWVWFAAARGRRWGSAAQYTVLPSRQAVRLPDEVSYDAGAGLGIPAMTAWHCLYGVGTGQAGPGPADATAPMTLDGRAILVAGGGGAVGNAAVSLARRGGAHVIATVSGPAKAELATAAGAHRVVNYRDADAAEQIRAGAPDGVDRIVEVALGANIALDQAVLAPHGVISIYADDPVTDFSIRPLMVLNATLAFVLVYGVADTDLDNAAGGVAAAVADGTLQAVLPTTRFPLAEIAAAQDAVAAGTAGKILVDLP